MSIKKQALKWLLTLNDLLQAILSLAMANSQWLLAFNASPAPFIVKPLLGLVLLSLLLFQAHELYLANQLELVNVLELIGNVLNISFTNIAIFGGIVATLLHTTFVAAPWFLVSAISIGLIQQLGMLIFNLFKAYQADCLLTRAHYLQAAFNNGLNWLLLGSTLIAVVLVLFFPVAPIALSIFASLCVTLLVTTILWRILPNEFKQQIKQGLGLSKEDTKEPEFVVENTMLTEQDSGEKNVPLTPIHISRRHSLYFWHNNEIVKYKEEIQVCLKDTERCIELS